MRFATFEKDGRQGLAVVNSDGSLSGHLAGDAAYPGALETLIGGGQAALAELGERLAAGSRYTLAQVRLLPPLTRPAKIICIGLNYMAHAKEAGLEVPNYPTLFARFASSLIGHEAPLLRPLASSQLDYEGELAVVIGKGGRRIAKAEALNHVAGYSVFNEGSVRDYQLKTTQWMAGKTFDGTGGFGPWLVTPDELPAGAAGLRLQTRVNGNIRQDTLTSDLIFDVAALIQLVSEAFTLEPGDVIVTGTPSGVGHARKPPVYLKAGDVCEVEIEGIGLLRNPVVDEAAA